jgi:hypothetical protein
MATSVDALNQVSTIRHHHIVQQTVINTPLCSFSGRGAILTSMRHVALGA